MHSKLNNSLYHNSYPLDMEMYDGMVMRRQDVITIGGQRPAPSQASRTTLCGLNTIRVSTGSDARAVRVIENIDGGIPRRTGLTKKATRERVSCTMHAQQPLFYLNRGDRSN
jgi:hypothetical protein